MIKFKSFNQIVILHMDVKLIKKREDQIHFFNSPFFFLLNGKLNQFSQLIIKDIVCKILLSSSVRIVYVIFVLVVTPGTSKNKRLLGFEESSLFNRFKSCYIIPYIVMIIKSLHFQATKHLWMIQVAIHVQLLFQFKGNIAIKALQILS